MIFINRLVDLYLTFARIGGVTLGSGYSMLPIIKNEVIDKKQWLNDQEVLECTTVAQSIPGVIAINLATSIGQKVAGIKGAIVSTLGITTFPAMIIIIIANFFHDLKKYEMAQKILGSVQALSVSMILIAILSLYRSGVKDIFQKVIFTLSLISALVFKSKLQHIIIASGLVSLAYKNLFRRAKRINNG